jgi:hypothetical protein
MSIKAQWMSRGLCKCTITISSRILYASFIRQFRLFFLFYRPVFILGYVQFLVCILIHQVFMKPGDCLFYESASVIHGRPLPLKGEFMANIFAHTKPLDWNFQMPNY